MSPVLTIRQCRVREVCGEVCRRTSAEECSPVLPEFRRESK